MLAELQIKNKKRNLNDLINRQKMLADSFSKEDQSEALKLDKTIIDLRKSISKLEAEVSQ